MKTKRHRRDVASASAALLYNILPEILKLPPPEQYRRLVAHIEGSLNAYEDAEETNIPEPSDN